MTQRDESTLNTPTADAADAAKALRYLQNSIDDAGAAMTLLEKGEFERACNVICTAKWDLDRAKGLIEPFTFIEIPPGLLRPTHGRIAP